MRLAAAAVGLLSVGAAGFAEPVRVQIEWRGAMDARRARPIRLAAVPQEVRLPALPPAARTAGVTRAETHVVTSAQEARLDLARGRWTVTAFADGFWSAPVVVDIGMARAAAAHVILWPASAVSGDLVAAPGAPAPTIVGVHLRGVPVDDRLPDVQGHAPTLTAVLRCPVISRRFRCVAPAGLFDLEVRPAGFIPLYAWDAVLGAGRETTLGRVHLRRGASIAGRIAAADGSTPSGPCHVAVAGEPALADARLTAAVDTRGWFQLAGAVVGERTLVVECAGARATRVVRVRPEAETRLGEPIVVDGMPLEIVVVPPLDPGRRPWRLDVFDATAGRQPIAVSEAVSASGRWARQGLQAGSYEVALRREDGSQWLSQPHELSERSGPLTLRASPLHVSGTVALASGPLAARLAFTDEAGSARVVFESGDDGRFEGHLPWKSEPSSLDWSVDVSANAPPVNRQLEHVIVRASRAEEGAWLDLLVPGAAARGIVLSEEGEPQQGAQVLGEGLDHTRHTYLATTDDKGAFELIGLPAGPYRVTAEGTHAVSPPQEVTIAEDVEPELRLVLARRKRLLVGQVRSSGLPVTGASVRVWLPPGVPRGSTPSDEQGRFEVTVPADVHEIGLTVGAPGYALKMTRARVTDAGPITVPLVTTTGALVLEALPGADSQDDAAGTFLMHDGTIESLAAVAEWATENGGGMDGNRLVVPGLEPGLYTMCWATPRDLAAGWALATGGAGGTGQDRCRAGTLSAGGTLWLSLPPSAASGSSR